MVNQSSVVDGEGDRGEKRQAEDSTTVAWFLLMRLSCHCSFCIQTFLDNSWIKLCDFCDRHRGKGGVLSKWV